MKFLLVVELQALAPPPDLERCASTYDTFALRAAVVVFISV